MNQPVITGVGVVSAFGVGARAFFGALSEGRSAVGPIRSFDATTFATRVAGEVPVETTDGRWARAQLQHETSAILDRYDEWGAFRDRKVAFGLLAASEAWHSAGCADSDREAWLTIALGLEQAFLEDFAPIFRD